MFNAARWMLALAILSTPMIARAQTEPTTDASSEPTSAPAGVESLKAIVTSVKGMAQIRLTHDDKWQTAVVGMELPQGAEIRTGTRSQIVCQIPPDQTITLDRLGTISIDEAIRSNGKTTTDLIMKYGRTDYAIESAGKEHDATIRTPNSTLAVRGTAFTAYDQPPFEPSVTTARGIVDFRADRRKMSVGKGSKARGSQGPVETALASSVVDPAAAKARTASENVVIANEINRGAVLEFDPFTQIATSMGGAGPQTDTQLIASLPGRLNFVIRWDTPNVDLNLAVLKVAGPDPIALLGSFLPQEVLYPGFGLDTTITGGRIVVDNRGGPRGGQEIGFYNKPESGLYGLQALHVSGPTAVVKFNAFLDGVPQTLFATVLDKDGNPVPNPDAPGRFLVDVGTTITRTVRPGELEVATALVFPPAAGSASAQSVRVTNKGKPSPTPSVATKTAIKTDVRAATFSKPDRPVAKSTRSR